MIFCSSEKYDVKILPMSTNNKILCTLRVVRIKHSTIPTMTTPFYLIILILNVSN